MPVYKTSFLKCVFILTVLLVLPSGATNFFERHGNNFIYLDSISSTEFDTLTYMPVIWDIRAGSIQLRDYYISYGWDTSTDWDSTLNAIDLLMEEAWDHGINFANARGEIWRMSTADLQNGPDSTHLFVNIAETVRLDSLNLIAGGFWTSVSDSAHNNAVIDYLAEYKDSSGIWSGGSGGFIGVFGFDEPDARYEGPGWDQCQYNTEWFDLLEDYADENREAISGDILPFGTFLCRYKTQAGDGLWYQNTIPLFCEELDYPVFGKYPCKYGDPVDRSYPDQVEFDEIIGSTDLIPSDSVDYYAYADRDEIFALDDSGWLRIYRFDNVTSHTDPIEITRADSVQLPSSLRIDPVWAASDFRASDVGDRDSGDNRLNGAVLFFNSTDPNDNMVVFHDGSDLLFLNDSINIRGALPATSAVCAGEYNYPVHHPSMSSRRGSVISRGELRILVCYRSSEVEGIIDRARIFEWNSSTEEFDDVTGDSLGIELDIQPVKAVWGVFWPSYCWWNPSSSDDASGFIVIDGSGNYQNIYEYIPGGGEIPEWKASDKFDNLFPWDETSFIARKTWGFTSYTAGMDYICHLESTMAQKGAVLEFASDPGGAVSSSLSVYESSEIDLPDSYEYFDINDASSCRPMKFVDDALVISFDDGTGGSEVYRSTSRVDFQGGDNINISLDSSELIALDDTDESPLLAAARVYSVRQPYRLPIVADPDLPNDPYQIALPEADIPLESLWDHFTDQHEALDTMFVYGIENTSRNNCLIHNLRCGGRRQEEQLTFYPPADTLLYLMTTALVHGCRGIHLRAMDITMMCGNGGDSAPSGTYRCPSLLMNWGPGLDNTNPDMIGRLFDIVQLLSGKNTSDPDFLSALIDERFSILDTAYVRNAEPAGGSSWKIDLSNDTLNFISLEDNLSGDILLLAVNDSHDSLVNDNYIRYPDLYLIDYTTTCIAGFECDTSSYDSQTRLFLDFKGMPAFSASLYLFEVD